MERIARPFLNLATRATAIDQKDQMPAIGAPRRCRGHGQQRLVGRLAIVVELVSLRGFDQLPLCDATQSFPAETEEPRYRTVLHPIGHHRHRMTMLRCRAAAISSFDTRFPIRSTILTAP